MTRATTAGHWLLHLLQPIFPSYKTSRLLLRLSTSLLFSPSVSPKALSLSAHRLPPSSAAVALLHVPCLLCRQRCPPWAHTPLGVSFTTSCWRCGCCSYPFHTHTHTYTHTFFLSLLFRFALQSSASPFISRSHTYTHSLIIATRRYPTLSIAALFASQPHSSPSRQGEGELLADNELVEHNLQRMQAAHKTMVAAHRFLFNAPGKVHTRPPLSAALLPLAFFSFSSKRSHTATFIHRCSSPFLPTLFFLLLFLTSLCTPSKAHTHAHTQPPFPPSFFLLLLLLKGKRPPLSHPFFLSPLLIPRRCPDQGTHT